MTAPGALTTTTDASYARSLTDRIKVAVEGTWHLITEAYSSRAWAALGYSSWDDYCTREFGTSRLRLPREERQEVVSSLREQGLSLRAIAAATGDSEPTVRRALAGASNDAPAERPVDETPGTEKDAHHRFDNTDDAIAWLQSDDDAEPDAFDRKIADELARSEGARIDRAAAGPVAAEETEPAKSVIGVDGKTYAAKPKTAPYRKPLPEVAKAAGWELRKAMERVEKLFDDNRYRHNEQQVALALRGHLLYVAETVAAVLDQLP